MKPPWVIRFEEEVVSFSELISSKFKSKIQGIKKYPLDTILKRAVAQKKYDIYHSTTIEGYMITPEEVEAVILGDKEKEGSKSFEKLRNKMSIIGHSQAFEYVISRIKKDFGKAKISEDLISEIYFQLFKPSVDVKIIDRFDLIGYRKSKVYIRGSRYVPPSFEKVSDLMKSFVAIINGIDNDFEKAVLAHYFFVTIHPYLDGNGRCCRLLMNYLLAASKYPWITITNEKRNLYFQALQNGQLDTNILPFAEFILNLV
jgi:Fic family protein